MPQPITLRVLFFSVLREHVGQPKLSVRLDAPADGDDLLDHLIRDYPALAAHRSTARLAVNQRLVPGARALQDDDEVAIMTPFSGG